MASRIRVTNRTSHTYNIIGGAQTIKILDDEIVNFTLDLIEEMEKHDPMSAMDFAREYKARQIAKEESRIKRQKDDADARERRLNSPA